MNWYYLPTSYVLARQPRHGRVQAPVARHYLPALEVKLASPVIRGFAARFLQYQTPGRYVPRPDAALVVAVQPPRGYIAKIERGGLWSWPQAPRNAHTSPEVKITG